MQKREPSVFLSYARTDSEVVRRVADGLAAAGVRVWLDEASLKPDTNWMQEIERELSAADFVAFFISPNSVKSGWAKQALQVALHRQVSGEGGAIILPVIIEDADVPPLLRQFQEKRQGSGLVITHSRQSGKRRHLSGAPHTT